jgi:hypothetical protein
VTQATAPVAAVTPAVTMASTDVASVTELIALLGLHAHDFVGLSPGFII